MNTNATIAPPLRVQLVLDQGGFQAHIAITLRAAPDATQPRQHAFRAELLENLRARNDLNHLPAICEHFREAKAELATLQSQLATLDARCRRVLAGLEAGDLGGLEAEIQGKKEDKGRLESRLALLEKELRPVCRTLDLTIQDVAAKLSRAHQGNLVQEQTRLLNALAEVPGVAEIIVELGETVAAKRELATVAHLVRGIHDELLGHDAELVRDVSRVQYQQSAKEIEHAND